MKIFEVSNIDEIKSVILENGFLAELGPERENKERMGDLRTAKSNIFLKNSDKSIYYLGLGYIKALSDWAVDYYCNLKIEFICDCDDDPALAQAAMKMGFKNIAFKGSVIYLEKLTQIADQYQVKIF